MNITERCHELVFKHNRYMQGIHCENPYQVHPHRYYMKAKVRVKQKVLSIFSKASVSEAFFNNEDPNTFSPLDTLIYPKFYEKPSFLFSRSALLCPMAIQEHGPSLVRGATSVQGLLAGRPGPRPRTGGRGGGRVVVCGEGVLIDLPKTHQIPHPWCGEVQHPRKYSCFIMLHQFSYVKQCKRTYQ